MEMVMREEWGCAIAFYGSANGAHARSGKNQASEHCAAAQQSRARGGMGKHMRSNEQAIDHFMRAPRVRSALRPRRAAFIPPGDYPCQAH
jgi:hypothetical protein